MTRVAISYLTLLENIIS